jgi:hypothetical protein
MPASKRYPLLLYREWIRPLALPLLAITVVMTALWAFSLTGLLAEYTEAVVPTQRTLLGLAALISFLAWVFVLRLPRAAYVQCLPEYLLLQLGFLRLNISYSRVRTTRSVLHGQIHPPAAQPRSCRKLAKRMAGWQCVAVELTSYPMAFFLLRAQTHPFLFIGDQPGFLFAVKDWMGLDREVEERNAALVAKRKDAARPPRLGGLFQ